MNWVVAQQLRELAEYGIQLQKEQAAAGLGSDGAPMPPLKSSSRRVFASRQNGVAQFRTLRGKTLRDLRTDGAGTGGSHMLDDIKINFMSDKQCTYGISTRLGRIKALANEQKAPWYGWSPDSVRKMTIRAGEIFGTGMAEALISMGLAGANALTGLRRGTFRRAA